MTIESDLAERLYNIGSAYRRAKVLLSAIELDLFSMLAKGPLDAAVLAGQLGIDRRGARDFFDALVALGLLNRISDGRYQNTKAGNLYLDKAKPTYLGGSFDQYNRREYGMWGSLTEALRTGRPRTEINGHDHFESIYHDPVRFRSFVDAMTAGSLLSARRIAEQFPWEQYRTLCDVGTAQGCLPVQVALAHSHIEAIGFDLPELASAFRQYAHENGLAQRLQFRAGDFFHDFLPEADVIVFGRVLHNWDLATKKMLLAKAHQALPEGGAVIVYDMLIDDERSSSASGLLSSLNMLLWTSGGFGYTGADCIGWMRGAGFDEMRVERLAGGNSMVVGNK
jgi:precorrin-6B methylase 2